MNRSDLDAHHPALARLDRCWTEAHVAAVEEAIPPAAVTPLASGNLFRARLHPHAAARWTWFENPPVCITWLRNRGNDVADDLAWRAGGALLTRPHDAVQLHPLSRAGCAFLDACAAGSTLADAARAALDVDSTVDLGCLMTTLLEAGAFSRLQMDA